MRVLGTLFRRLFLTRLLELHAGGKLQFFGAHGDLSDRRAFNRHLARKKRWVVYAKPPFSGPETVLAYLSRNIHQVAISNHNLISFDKAAVTFHYKNHRQSGAERHRTMTLQADEFIPALSTARPADRFPHAVLVVGAITAEGRHTV